MARMLKHTLHKPMHVFNIPNILLKSTLSKDGNKLNICHVNGGAIFNKIDDVRRIFEDANAHVIILSETWLKSYRSNASVNIEGFDVIRNDRQRIQSGGVAVYIKKGLRAKVVKTSSGIKSEYLFLEIIFPNSKILIGAYYKAPKVDEISLFDDALSDLLVNYTDIIIMGDFNENLLRRDGDGNCAKCKSRCCSTCRFISCLDKHGLESIGSTPTNFDQTPSLIDLMLTNEPSKVTFFNQISTSLSNHDLLFASFIVPDDITNDKPNLWRNYRAVNVANLISDLMGSNVNRIFDSTEIDEMMSIFNEVLLNLLDKHAPLKPFIRTAGINSTKPWYTEEMSSAAVNQELARRAYKACKTTANLVKYRNLRNAATQLVKDAKKDFLRPRLNHKIGMKQVWTNARELGLVRGRKNDLLSPAFTADEFNKHTTSCAGDEGEATTYHTQAPELGPSNITRFAFRCVSELEVFEAANAVKTKAIGLDGIPLNFIKLILVHILPHITHIINSCITRSKCPSVWKKAKVLPSHKKSKTYNMDDYRGLSILPIFSKVFEILLKTQMREYLDMNKLIAARQSGFRSLHSTTTALLKISDDIRRAMNRKMTATILLLDFTKAFDSVVHKVLCEKLRTQFFFDSTAVSLISEYLSGRVQAVCIDGVMSDFLPVTKGIPQGSVLGPMLFLLFINDMPGSVRFVLTHLFADDVQLYKVFASADLVRSTHEMNRDMNAVCKWAIINKLELNVKKSQGIVISEGLVDFSPLIRLNGAAIPFYNKVKNLGLTINNKFKWLDHAEFVHSKVFAGLRSLWPLSSATPLRTREMLAKSLLMPHFEYCSTIFAYGLDYGAKTTLSRAFDAVIRYVYGLSRRENVELHAIRFLGYSLLNFYKFKDMSFLYKLIRLKTPSYLSDLVKIDFSSRTKQVQTVRCDTMLRNSLFGKGLVDWNRIPVAIRCSGSYEVFCNRYFDHTR